MEKLVQMRELEKIKELRDSVAYMVIDIKNKTNEQVKLEVSSRVGEIFKRSQRDTAIEIKKNKLSEIEVATLYKSINEEYNRQYTKMINQFYYQIDMLIPLHKESIKEQES